MLKILNSSLKQIKQVTKELWVSSRTVHPPRDIYRQLTSLIIQKRRFWSRPTHIFRIKKDCQRHQYPKQRKSKRKVQTTTRRIW